MTADDRKFLLQVASAIERDDGTLWRPLFPMGCVPRLRELAGICGWCRGNGLAGISGQTCKVCGGSGLATEAATR